MPAQRVNEYFTPIPSNASIENYDARRGRTLTKGAFTDEARNALAVAVKARKVVVQMDHYTMVIKYHAEHVYITSTDNSGLPCGVFYYKDLAQRISHDS